MSRKPIGRLVFLVVMLAALGCDRKADGPEVIEVDDEIDLHDSDSDSETETDDELPSAEDCYQGNLEIFSGSAADFDELKTYPCVTGDLNLGFWFGGSLDLSNLIWVGGFLMIQDSDSLGSLDLSGLREVGDWVEIVSLYDLHSLDLGSLESIGGDFGDLREPRSGGSRHVQPGVGG